MKLFLLYRFTPILLFFGSFYACLTKKEKQPPMETEIASPYSTKLNALEASARINGKLMKLVPSDSSDGISSQYIPSLRAVNLYFKLFPIKQNEESTLEMTLYLSKDANSRNLIHYTVFHQFHQFGSDAIEGLHYQAKPSDFKISPIYFLQPDSTFSFRFSGILSHSRGYMGKKVLEHYKLPDQLLIEDGYLRFKL